MATTKKLSWFKHGGLRIWFHVCFLPWRCYNFSKRKIKGMNPCRQREQERRGEQGWRRHPLKPLQRGREELRRQQLSLTAEESGVTYVLTRLGEGDLPPWILYLDKLLNWCGSKIKNCQILQVTEISLSCRLQIKGRKLQIKWQN